MEQMHPTEEGGEVEGGAVPLEKVQEFLSWQRKIHPLIQLLDKTPSSELEVIICSGENHVGKDNSKFLMDVKLGAKCQTLYNELLDKVNEKNKQSVDLWEEMQGLFKRMRDKENFQLTFTTADSGLLKSMHDLKAQMLLREKEMHQRIEVFIGELRKDISDIWDQCMITDEEKNEFSEFNSDQFTEEMLDIHNEELKKWQLYHKKNQEILTMITKRGQMWVKLRELETKADDPNRFVNRGGALLKDQNMHNSITKNLPKLESELIKLAEKFEHEHGRKMKILGKEIPLMIEEEWKLFKEQKAAKKLSRQFLTPSASAPISASTGSIPLRATRHSIMPIQMGQLPSSNKAGEKRPGSRLNATPLSKRKFTSAECVNNPP